MIGALVAAVAGAELVLAIGPGLAEAWVEFTLERVGEELEVRIGAAAPCRELAFEPGR